MRGTKGKGKAAKAKKAGEAAPPAATKAKAYVRLKAKAPKTSGRRGRPPTLGPSPRVIKRLVAQLAFGAAEKAQAKRRQAIRLGEAPRM
jgi:hypothetical protein